MSVSVLILGESGTGKSASLRNMNPEKTLLIQAIKKPLPFRSASWKQVIKGTQAGNIFVTDQFDRIITIMTKTQREIIVIDDFQYVLANEFMRRSQETGFAKFTEIGRHAWEILNIASQLPDNKRIYILSHTESDQSGLTKCKTIGKMLDEKITVEGMFTIVLRTLVQDQQYKFSTQNNGADTVKSPMGMFAESLIDNDLEAIDSVICEYYGIPKLQLVNKEAS